MTKLILYCSILYGLLGTTNITFGMENKPKETRVLCAQSEKYSDKYDLFACDGNTMTEEDTKLYIKEIENIYETSTEKNIPLTRLLSIEPPFDRLTYILIASLQRDKCDILVYNRNKKNLLQIKNESKQCPYILNKPSKKNKT